MPCGLATIIARFHNYLTRAEKAAGNLIQGIVTDYFMGSVLCVLVEFVVLVHGFFLLDCFLFIYTMETGERASFFHYNKK